MAEREVVPIIFLLLCLILFNPLAVSETDISDSSVFKISQYIWLNEFPKAIDGAKKIIEDEPSNPVGYFLLGAVYQTISEAYRNDHFKEEIYNYLGQAIDVCDERKRDDPKNPDWYFISGAAYGYRGLYRAFHGGWWGAFRDGARCKSNLKKALKLDSTYYDAYWGLGCYYYYRTIKARSFLWLPFISDKREEGMALIREAIAKGYLASNNARESFLTIYLIEERFEDLVCLADSLCGIIPGDPYFLLYYTEGLLALDRLEEAEEKLQQLKSAWENSPYFDSLGVLEAEFLLAKVAYKKDKMESVREITDRIISRKELRKSNAYFAETYKKTKDLAKKSK